MSASPQTHRDSLERGVQVAVASRIAATATAVIGQSAAIVRASRAIALARRSTNEFRASRAAERTRCVLIAAAAALGGHLVMARLLPESAAPMLSLTVLALIGAGLTAAVSAQRGAGEQEILQPDHVARRPH